MTDKIEAYRLTDTDIDIVKGLGTVRDTTAAVFRMRGYQADGRHVFRWTLRTEYSSYVAELEWWTSQGWIYVWSDRAPQTAMNRPQLMFDVLAERATFVLIG